MCVYGLVQHFQGTKCLLMLVAWVRAKKNGQLKKVGVFSKR